MCNFNEVTEMQMAKTVSLIFGVALLVAACAPATPAPTATATALPTATAAPPTVTPIPPTATLMPTPIPTADFAPEALQGVWTRADPERGQLYLTFTATGGYLASHGEPSGVVHAGAYILEGRVLTFVDGWRDCELGSYLVKITPNKFISLEILDDATCRSDRGDALARRRWNWYVP